MAEEQKRRDFGSVRRVQPSGRWQASYLNPQDKSRRINAPTTYTLKSDAEAWLHDERRAIERGTWTSPLERAAASVTVEVFGRDWLNKHRVRESTRVLYSERLEDHVFPHLGSRRLSSLTTADVRRWYQERVQVASESSVGIAYTALSSMLSSAVEKGTIDRNPCTLKGVRKDTTNLQAKAVGAKELRLIADAMRPDYSALVLIGGWCGLRWGELVGLRRRDVDRETNEITVYEAVRVERHRKNAGAPRAGQPHEKAATFVRGDVKTKGSRRIVDIPPHITPAIQDHLDNYVEKHADALLFRARKSAKRPVSGSTFHPWYKAALAEAGVPEMRVHDLRHTAATLAMETGQASGYDVMKRLGHTSSRTADRYQHVQKNRQRGLAAGLSELAVREDPDH
jgi:integrase